MNKLKHIKSPIPRMMQRKKIALYNKLTFIVSALGLAASLAFYGRVLEKIYGELPSTEVIEALYQENTALKSEVKKLRKTAQER